jgi:uncharacterized protein (DUF1330 family)
MGSGANRGRKTGTTDSFSLESRIDRPLPSFLHDRPGRGTLFAPEPGKALIRTSEVEPRESGLNQRLVVIEFESVERAVATYQSAAYQAALQALGSAAERDFRIVEGV